MIKRLSFYGFFALLLLFCACFFAFTGSGNYAYEGQAGDPDSTVAGDSCAVDTTGIDETLDEEFDLLDADTRYD